MTLTKDKRHTMPVTVIVTRTVRPWRYSHHEKKIDRQTTSSVSERKRANSDSDMIDDLRDKICKKLKVMRLRSISAYLKNLKCSKSAVP
jgi:hypothetical protein